MGHSTNEIVSCVPVQYGRMLRPFFQVICSHSSVPDCLDSVPLSLSHPQQKTCNNSNRHSQPNKHFGERLMKAHNSTDSNNRFAKLHGQIVMTVCIGLHFVIPIIPPVCHNGIPCHLNTCVKKGLIQLCPSRCKYHINNCMGCEWCWVKLLSLSLSVSMNEHQGIKLCWY